MIALKITEIGTFINKLLKDGMCDHFLLQEAVITQAATYTIDGSFHPDYYEPEELDTLHLQDLSYLPFSLLRPSCLKIMQGKKKPLFFKFVFLLSRKTRKRLSHVPAPILHPKTSAVCMCISLIKMKC